MTARSAVVLGADGLPQQLQPGDSLTPPFNALGDKSGTVNITLNDGTYTMRLVGYCDLTVTAGASGQGARLLITRSSTAAYDMTTPAGWKWSGSRQAINPGATEELELLLLPNTAGVLQASIRSFST